MSQLWLVVLVVVAAAGIWLGFAEDFEIGMVVALVALVAATLYAFHGGFGSLGELPEYAVSEPKPPKQKRGMSNQDMATMKLTALVVIGVVVGAGGFWLGFAEDIEVALLIGVLAVAGATLAAFRGKAAF